MILSPFKAQLFSTWAKRTLHPTRDYRLLDPVPRGSKLWLKKHNVRTSIQSAYSAAKESHPLANPRIRGPAKVKTHVYLAIAGK
jgi:hypothetical protein